MVNRRNFTFESKMKYVSILLLASVFFAMEHTSTKYLLVEVDDGAVKDADRSIGRAKCIN